GGIWTYSLEASGDTTVAIISSYKGEAKSITIPSVITAENQTYPVKGLNHFSIEAPSSVETLVIPEGVDPGSTFGDLSTVKNIQTEDTTLPPDSSTSSARTYGDSTGNSDSANTLTVPEKSFSTSDYTGEIWTDSTGADYAVIINYVGSKSNVTIPQSIDYIDSDGSAKTVPVGKLLRFTDSQSPTKITTLSIPASIDVSMMGVSFYDDATALASVQTLSIKNNDTFTAFSVNSYTWSSLESLDIEGCQKFEFSSISPNFQPKLKKINVANTNISDSFRLSLVLSYALPYPSDMEPNSEKTGTILEGVLEHNIDSVQAAYGADLVDCQINSDGTFTIHTKTATGSVRLRFTYNNIFQDRSFNVKLSNAIFNKDGINYDIGVDASGSRYAIVVRYTNPDSSDQTPVDVSIPSVVATDQGEELSVKYLRSSGSSYAWNAKTIRSLTFPEGILYEPTETVIDYGDSAIGIDFALFLQLPAATHVKIPASLNTKPLHLTVNGWTDLSGLDAPGITDLTFATADLSNTFMPTPTNSLTSLNGIQNSAHLKNFTLTSPASITSLDVLSGHQTLEVLRLSNNKTTINDLSVLESLPSLKQFDLPLTGGDLSALKNCNTLTTLSLTEVPANSDLSVFKDMTALSTLSLSGTGKLDVTPLGEKALSNLSLNGFELENSDTLGGLTDLNYLSIKGCTGYSNLDFTQTMAKLQSLRMDGARLTDAKGLGHLEALDSLSITNSTLADVSSLNGLKNVTFMNLTGTIKAEDLSVLKGLSSLKYLVIGNGIDIPESVRMDFVVPENDALTMQLDETLQFPQVLGVLNFRSPDAYDITLSETPPEEVGAQAISARLMRALCTTVQADEPTAQVTVEKTPISKTNADLPEDEKNNVSGYQFELTAQSTGTTYATLTAKTGERKTFKIIVGQDAPSVKVESITLNKSAVELPIGSTEELTATVLPTNASNKNVTWSSSDATIATVNQNGRVTAVSEGKATITVTTEDGSRTAAASITVTKASSGSPTLPSNNGTSGTSKTSEASTSNASTGLDHHGNILMIGCIVMLALLITIGFKRPGTHRR
ncbi:MAG: Ig-like domain-containing protein, partial [Eubacterium sp.]